MPTSANPYEAVVVDTVLEHIAYLDAQVAGFEEGLQSVANGLTRYIEDTVPNMSGVNQTLALRNSVYLQGQIRGQLTKLGYQDMVQEFVSGYDESALFAEQLLGALGRSDMQMSPLPAQTLADLKNFDLDAFQEIGTRAVRTLSKELTMNALIGKPRSAVIAAMDQVLEGQFVGQGVMFADTALRSFDRTVTGQMWTSAGIDRYKYFGPRDRVTRPFCRERIGKIYSLAEIRVMDNRSSQFSDVFRYGGGPRCRHSWIPQVD